MSEQTRPPYLEYWINGATKLIAATKGWQQWRGENEQQSARSIYYEEAPPGNYPCAVLMLQQYGWRNFHDNVKGRGYGEFLLMFVDKAQETQNPSDSAVYFANRFGLVIDDMVELIASGQGFVSLQLFEMDLTPERYEITKRDGAEDLWRVIYRLPWDIGQ